MPALGPGSPLPRLDLRDARGEPASLPEGDALLVFFKTTCPTCELLWPYLDRLHRRSGGGGLSVVGVSQDDPATTREFSRALGAEVPTLYDPRPWKASDAVDLTNVPTLFVIGADGRIRDTVVGFQKAKMQELDRRASDAASAESRGPLFRPDERVPESRPG